MIPQDLTAILEDQGLLTAALDATSSGITISDARHSDLPIIYVNRGFEQLTGYNHKEVLGRNCRFLQSDNRDQESIREIANALREQRHCKVILRNYRKSGEPFWNELILSPVLNSQGTLTHFVGIQNDVTEREEMRLELNEQRDKLRIALEDLRCKTEDNKKLLSLVAHDLRAPLANIQSLNDLAVQSKNAEEANRWVQMSSNLAADTRELVSDLLHWRSIERGDFEIRTKSVDLKAFAESIEKYLVHAGDRKEIRVKLAYDFQADHYDMDVKRIQQVISNLVSNAIKYSERGSRIEVRMASTEKEFVLSVRDFGKGIAKEELGKLFRAFEKTSTIPTEGESSFGLGLSIVHKIVEMHGGKVAVESDAGVGTCFTIRV